MDEIKVGRWDCRVCNTKGILGPKKQCTACGSPRPKDVEFYLTDDAETLTDEAAIEQALEGPDWVCSYCSSHNLFAATVCAACSNPKSVRDELIDVEEIERKKREKAQARQAERNRLNKSLEESKKKKRKQLLLLMFGIIGLFVLKSVLFPKTYAVEDKYFITTVMLEFDTTYIQKEAWTLPKDAYNVSQERKIRRYNSVKIGEERKKRYGTSTSYPSGFNELRILSTSEKKVSNGYKRVADGTESYYTTERVKSGSKRVKCGKKNLGNGHFKIKYCNKPIYKSKRVRKTRTKYKQVKQYKKVKSYRYSYVEVVPMYEKVPEYGILYRFDHQTRARKKLNLGKKDFEKGQNPLQLRKDRNEVILGRKTQWAIVLRDDPKNRNYYRGKVDSVYWHSVQVGDRLELEKVPGTLYSEYTYRRNR